MNKIFLTVTAILLVSGLIFNGCAKPVSTPTTEPTPAPTAPTPTPTQAPTPAPVKPIKLKFSFAPPMRNPYYTDAFVPWAEQLEQRTAAIGKPVDIVFYGGGALGDVQAQYELTKTGIVDISALWNPQQYPGVFPLNDILTLPFLVHGCKAASLVAQELYDTQPAFKKEYDDAGVKVIGFHAAPDTTLLLLRSREVKTMEDLKGMKISSVGSVQAQALTNLGSIPVTMAPPDVYMSLERGLLDGTLSNPSAIFTAFNFHEVTKYRTVLPIGMFSNPLVLAMNPDSFNSLAPEVQKIFNELTGAYVTGFTGEAVDKAQEQNYNDLVAYDKKKGNPEHYLLPDTELNRWVEATKPVRASLIAELEAKGLPAKTIYEETLRLIEKYSK